MSTTVLETIQHRIGGAERRGASTRTAPVYDPATGARAGRGAAGRAGRRRRRGAAAKRRPSRAGSDVVARRAARGSCSRSATWSSSATTTSRGSSPPSTARSLDDAKGEVIRGMEVVEFACGIPKLLKGEYSDQVSTDVDSYSLPPAARRVRRDHAVQLPGHGPDVDAPDGDRDAATRSCSSRPSATRRRRTSSPSCTPRPGCPTACSTSCTATRSRSTRCSTTRTSRRSRSSARRRSRRYVHEHGERRTASGCRRSAARRTTRSCCPTPTSTSPPNHLIAAGYGSAGQRCMAISVAVAVGDVADAAGRAAAREGAGDQGRPGPRARLRDGPGGHRRRPATGSPATSARARRRRRRWSSTAASCDVEGDGFFVGPTLFDHVTPRHGRLHATRSSARCWRSCGWRRSTRRSTSINAQPVRQRHRDLHLERRGRAHASSARSRSA